MIIQVMINNQQITKLEAQAEQVTKHKATAEETKTLLKNNLKAVKDMIPTDHQAVEERKYVNKQICKETITYINNSINTQVSFLVKTFS